VRILPGRSTPRENVIWIAIADHTAARVFTADHMHIESSRAIRTGEKEMIVDKLVRIEMTTMEADTLADSIGRVLDGARTINDRENLRGLARLLGDAEGK